MRRHLLFVTNLIGRDNLSCILPLNYHTVFLEREPDSNRHHIAGADKVRTCDNLNANQVLYQLSYNPLYVSAPVRRASIHNASKQRLGMDGFEPPPSHICTADYVTFREPLPVDDLSS